MQNKFFATKLGGVWIYFSEFQCKKITLKLVNETVLENLRNHESIYVQTFHTINICRCDRQLDKRCLLNYPDN